MTTTGLRKVYFTLSPDSCRIFVFTASRTHIAMATLVYLSILNLTLFIESFSFTLLTDHATKLAN